MAMKDTTPYRDRPPTEIAREQACMRKIFAAAPPVPFIFETFAGLGVTAEVLRERFPDCSIIACDLDQACVDTYNTKRYGRAVLGDCRDVIGSLHIGRHWGVSLDFNKLTLMDLRLQRPGKEGKWKLALLDQVAAQKPAWIQVTDSACRYLHLNWQRYGLAANDLALYHQAVAAFFRERYDYTLKATDQHHAASYMLFIEG